MAREKIMQFYGDPAKRTCDANAQAMTEYARSMAMNPSALWTARRYRNYYAQRLRYWIRRQVARRSACTSAVTRDSPRQINDRFTINETPQS